MVDESYTNSCNNNQQPSDSITSQRRMFRRTKRKHFAANKVARGNNPIKAKAVSKKIRSTDIISQVIHLEKKTGCTPGLLDLLCVFSHAEIHAVWDELMWLYPELCSKGYATIPSDVDHKELMKVMA